LKRNVSDAIGSNRVHLVGIDGMDGDARLVMEPIEI
jgi:hypothetical protein